MNGASVLPVMLFAAWLPFTGEPPVHDDDATIKGLYESDGRQRIPDNRTKKKRFIDEETAAEQAKANYRAFLELVADDPVLSAEAARRLADLELETGEVWPNEFGPTAGSVSTDAGPVSTDAGPVSNGAGPASTAVGLASTAVGPVSTGQEEAIRLYTHLLEAWPDNPRNDRVLYQLARVHEGAGRSQDALATLDRLVAGWPQTGYLAEAQFRRGEILFVQKRYAEAQSAYAAVLALGPEAAFHDESRYKHGWSLFKQGLHQESLDSFFGVLDDQLLTPEGELESRESLARAERELVGDTLRVLGISFSYLDGARSLDAWFADRSSPYAHLLYAGLGELYLDKERYTDAAETLQAFVDRHPRHAGAPLLQAKAIEAYAQGGFSGLVLEGKEAYIGRYGMHSPFWEDHIPAERPEVIAQLSSHLDDVTRHYHAQAQASRQPADFALAAHWYREALRSLPDRADAAHIRFLLAEVLFESGQFGEATGEYERAAYEYPAHAKAAEAGYAALLAYGKHEAALEGPERRRWHSESIDSALRFAARFPAHARTGAVLTKAAEDLFALDELEHAIDAGGQVVALEPAVDPALARTAWTVIAHARFDLGRYAEAEAAYLRVLGLPAAGDAVSAAIEERLAASIYRQAEERRAAGDAEGAVAQFLRIAEAAPASDARATAEFDAAALLMEQEQWPRAITVLEAFRREHPAHQLSGEVTRKLAVAYLAAGQGTLAAGELVRIADDGTAPPDVRSEALWQAAELYAEADHEASAAAAYETYVARFPLPLDAAMNARQRLADLAGARGDAAAQIRWLQALVAADAAAGGARSERSRYLAAKAALAVATPAFDAFNGLNLTIPLDQSLARKKARMETALAAYGRAADYGVAEVTTAATFHIAEIYHELSRDLLGSERPRDLAPEELEQYDILLEEQAFPFEEKAIELHQLNTARAVDGAWDEWVRGSYAELAKLLPVRYAKVEMREEHVNAIR